MRGAINHVAMTVADLAASEEAFHAPVLGWLGYAKVQSTPAMTLWWNAEAGLALTLWQAQEEGPHRRYAPGFHHLAFSADSRAEVDDLHALLLDRSIRVLDPPAEYPHYAPGYYAVFFEDPDGLKYEYVHMPAVPD